MGYKDSPCLSPAEHSKKSENMPFNLTHDFNLLYIDLITFNLTHDFNLLYIDLITFNYFSVILHLSNLYHN